MQQGTVARTDKLSGGDRLVRSRLRHSSLLLSMLSIAAVGLLAAPVTASASSSHKSSGNCVTANGVRIRNNPLLCKGIAFYKGTTITMIIAGSVGGAADTQVRTQTPYIAKYLGANVNDEELTGANGVQGMDATAHASATGLTIGTLNLATTYAFQIQKVAGINFNPERLGWISENASGANLVVAKSNSSCTTIAAMKVASPPCAVVSSATGIAPMQGAILFGLLDIPVKWLNVYPSNAAVTAGFARGDGPVTLGNVPALGGFLQAGQAITVTAATKLAPGTAYRAYIDKAPTMVQLVNGIKTTNKKTIAAIAAFKSLLNDGNGPIVTQTAVAPYKLEALRAAFDWMAAQPTIGPAMLAAGSVPKFYSGTVAKNNYLGVEGNLQVFAPYLVPVIG